MKKILVLFMLLFAVARLSAQSYTVGHISVTMSDSASHDTTTCTTSWFIYYHITVDTSFVNDTLYVIDSLSGTLLGVFANTTGATPWVFTTGAGGAPFGSATIPGSWDIPVAASGHSYFVPSTKKIRRGIDTLYAAGTLDSFAVPDPCLYSTVSGNAFADNNGNCIYDAGDDILNFPYDFVNYSGVYMPGGGGWNGSFGSSQSGATYTINVQKSWIASCTVSLPSYYYFVFGTTPGCPAGPYTFTSLPATGADFPLLCTANVDVQCNALAPSAVRAHTPFLLHPYVSNIGCDTASGLLRLVLDPRVTYSAALSAHPADYVSGDTLFWNYSGLTNRSSYGYWNSFVAGVHLTPITSVAAGDSLCFSVIATTPTADINPVNNYVHFCLPVVYSYDPNSKEVSPAGTGATGDIPGTQDTLTYTLHFQNTGSAPAIDVRVIDTLDSHIDPASLRILGATHNMSPEWLTPNVVRFNFDNINLADSLHNEPASHGAVSFRVKLRSGMPAGTQIRNTGYIYFDLNPPVVTNTVLNTLTSPTDVLAQHPIQGIKLYPNPASDVLNIDMPDAGTITLLSVDGAVVLQKQYKAGTASLPVSALPFGLYIVKVVTDKGLLTARFSKF